MKAAKAPAAMIAISHHHLTNWSDMPNTKEVNAGRSAPKLTKVSLKVGTTNTIRTPQTMIATAITVAG